MSVLSMIMLVLVINPVTALLVPVLFRLAIKSDKVMDYFTYGKYVLLYFALLVAVSFAAGLNQSLAGPLARNSAMNSCMMAYGFRKQRMCVSNC